MKSITKDEMFWLLEKGYLKRSKGKIEFLVVTSKNKTHNGKDRYVTDQIYEKLNNKNKGDK